MNTTARSFLEEYRSADLTQRLHLYLQYPEMRSAYDQIEYNEPPPGQLGRQPGRSEVRKARKVRPWRLFRLLPGLERRCCRCR